MKKIEDMLQSIDKQKFDGMEFSIQDNVVELTLLNKRTQKITILNINGLYDFRSRVVRRSVLPKKTADLLKQIFQWNIQTDLVSFFIDDSNYLVGSIVQPVETLDEAELIAFLIVLARECDNLEFLLTGQDVE